LSAETLAARFMFRAFIRKLSFLFQLLDAHTLQAHRTLCFAQHIRQFHMHLVVTAAVALFIDIFVPTTAIISASTAFYPSGQGLVKLLWIDGYHSGAFYELQCWRR